MVKDLNYFPLDVESNIYGMTKLEFEDMTSKILVATIDCRLYCISYNKFKPQTKEVQFTYIPNGAKIISIGALKRGLNDFVIGITHSLSQSSKASAGVGGGGGVGGGPPNVAREMAGDISLTNRQTTTYYLNIYASESRDELSNSFDLDHVAQGCQTIRLRYVPYHLYSTELITYDDNDTTAVGGKLSRQPIWLLSGGDDHIHAYNENRPYQSFTECSMEDCFPEICDKQQSVALWIDVVNTFEKSKQFDRLVRMERAVALGFENGSVRLYQSVFSSQTNKYELIRASSFDAYTTIIPCVRLFTINSMDLEGSRLRRKLLTNDEPTRNQTCDATRTQEEMSQLNLLVVSSTNESLIFRNVLHKGLDDKYEMASSKRLDCVTSAAIGDTNASGYNDLLLGTHGKELLTYHYDTPSRSYQLSHVDILNYPIFSLNMLDLTGDGLKDVTILLASGILIVQTVVKDLMDLCKRRLNVVLSKLHHLTPPP